MFMIINTSVWNKEANASDTVVENSYYSEHLLHHSQEDEIV